MSDIPMQAEDGRSSHSVTGLLLRWQAGDDDAQFDLTCRLQGLVLELTRYVRRNRAPNLAARIDSEGLVNKALCAFLVGARVRAFPDLCNRENIRKLLFDMVGKALLQEIRDNERACRDADREIHDEQALQHVAAPATGEVFAPTSDEGETQLRLPAEEFLELLQKRVRPVHEKAMDILELLLANWSSGDIARNLDMGQRNVQNIIKRMRDAWFGDDGLQGEADDECEHGQRQPGLRPVGAVPESVPHGLPLSETPSHPGNP